MAEPSVEPRTVKGQRINLRATQHQTELLRRASEVSNNSLTDFILSSAVDRAEHVLADLRWFTATDQQYAAFVELLDAPLPTTTRFDRLFARQSRFAESE